LSPIPFQQVCQFPAIPDAPNSPCFKSFSADRKSDGRLTKFFCQSQSIHPVTTISVKTQAFSQVVFSNARHMLEGGTRFTSHPMCLYKVPPCLIKYLHLFLHCRFDVFLLPFFVDNFLAFSCARNCQLQFNVLIGIELKKDMNNYLITNEIKNIP